MTMKGRNWIIGVFAGILFLFMQAPLFAWAGQEEDSEAQPDFSLYAASAALIDAQSGRVLYGKNADTPMAMASTTKIMTCIVVLENADMEDTLQVSSYAAGMPKVKLYLKKGETYTVKDLLYSLMLESHNDTAAALAEHIGKRYLSQELQNKSTADFTTEESRMAVAAFASLMNAKAKELGCENTYFITPNGLDATETITLNNGETVEREHCTTATELARIMAYCVGQSPKKDAFLEITRTPSYSFSANGRSFSCTNHNAFLNMMTGALSGKTGFTNKAGYCYVGALENEGRTFVVALLACGWPNNKNYKWSDTKELMQYGLDSYFYQAFSEQETAISQGDLAPIPVEGGRTRILGETAFVPLSVQEDEDGLSGLLLREGEEIQVECRIKKNLKAPVESGTVVGNIYYIVDDTIYRTDTVIAMETVEKIDFAWCLEQICCRFLQTEAAGAQGM